MRSWPVLALRNEDSLPDLLSVLYGQAMIAQ